MRMRKWRVRLQGLRQPVKYLESQLTAVLVKLSYAPAPAVMAMFTSISRASTRAQYQVGAPETTAAPERLDTSRASLLRLVVLLGERKEATPSWSGIIEVTDWYDNSRVESGARDQSKFLS